MKHRQEADKAARALVADLRSCSLRRDLEWGRRIHARAVESGTDSNMRVATALIKMYAKCRSMTEARRVFDLSQNRDAVTWTALIQGYAENGEGRLALDLFSGMRAHGCEFDSVTYMAALKACTSLAVRGDSSEKRDCLELGREIHSRIHCHLNHYVQNTLIVMYAKCGSMVEARQVFDSIPKPDVVSWNSLLLGYAESGEGLTALDLFSLMKARGCAPDSVTYVAALKACTSLAVNGNARECLNQGRKIHSEIDCSDYYVQNSLVNMYAKCGSMVEAHRVFCSINKPDVVSWTALLLGYAESGDGLVALDLFSRMKASGCVPNSVTYVAALKACTYLASDGDERRKDECLKRGREIHLEIGCHLDRYVQNTLVDMYVKCGSMEDARRVFDGIKNPDAVSWTALLLGYADTGEGQVALDLFSRMKASACLVDSVVYVAALKACRALAVNGDCCGRQSCLEQGRKIHSEIGCHLDHCVQCTLIDMYAKCGSMVEARRAFDCLQDPDVVSWNALLLGYADNGEGIHALELFSRMKTGKCAPNSLTYVAALRACTSLAVKGDVRRKWECFERGREIHLEIGPHLDSHVQKSLIDMYAKCGRMMEARRVFDDIEEPDAISWNALLLGYAENGDGFAALDSFERMKASGLPADSVTYIAALKACSSIGALALGRTLHSEIGEFTAHVVTCLVDFYAKCGSMVEAREVFDSHSGAGSVPTWNALLAGYASFGDTASVFNLFEAMQDKGFRPDAVTFMSILLCCSHAGLVEKAREYFEGMPGRYGVTPTVEHYTCMVDVLGRANQLNEAITVLRKMPCTPDAVTWRVLLGACHKWKDVEVGRMAFQSLVGLDKKDASAYVLMAQIYGSRGMWDEQERVLETKKSFAGEHHGCVEDVNIVELHALKR